MSLAARTRYVTHRCEGSLAAACSLRKVKPDGPTWVETMWHLYRQEHNFDYDTTYMAYIAPVRFCPWCGERLEDA